MRGGAPADRARAAHSHRVGRPVPHLGCRAGLARDGGRSAQASDLDDGQEDHGRFRHARQQGARSHRSPFPLLGVIQSNRYRYPPAIGDSWFRRVRRRLGARAGRIPDDGAADPLRVDLSGPGARSRRAPLRSRRGRHAHLRGAAPRAVPGLRRRARGGAAGRHGAGAVQRGQRGGCPALPGREDPVWADSRSDRASRGSRGPGAGSRGVSGGSVGGGRRSPPPGTGSRMPLTILSLVIVLGVLISVHEFGHFIVAKAVGIQVLRFSLGFGRPLISCRGGAAEDWISWIPLGGYVKMAGLEEEGMVGELEGGKASVPIDPARAFDQQPLWARMAVILAGVTMNVVLAFIIYTGLAAISGVPARATTEVDTVLVSRLPQGTEALATLQRGDRIVAINGDTVRTWEDVQKHLILDTGSVRLDIAGKGVIRVTLPREDNARLGLARWGLEPLMPARIGKVLPGEPARRAGLKAGDLVVRAGADTVRSWSDLIHKLWLNPGHPIALSVVRGDSVLQLTVSPRAETEPDSQSARPKTFGYIGAEGDFVVNRRISVGQAIVGGAKQTASMVVVMVESVKRLVSGRASVREVGGPITIAQVSGQAARLGLVQFLSFLAFFSVSLAVLNLLPIPVLDGGHAMFLIAEGIRRRPLSPQLRLRLTQLGMLVVLAIMVVALSNDVLRLFR